VDQGTASAVYLHLTNLGDQPDRLLGAESPLAEAVELHSTSLEGDMAHMMPVAGIDLPPGATVVLEPGGGHLMVVNLAGPLAPGDRLPLILLFEMAGDVELDAEVREP
jgi:copper(I)-binding protein